MKILLYNRDPNTWVGGDMVQLNNTKKALEELGIHIDVSHKTNISLTSYYLVHMFHINFNFCRDMYERLLLEKKPYIISAIFYNQVYDLSFEDMSRYAKGAQAIIALSDNEKKEMVGALNVSEDKVIVIPNGVDKQIFKPIKTRREDKVISVGRLEPDKGPHLLIQACLRLKIPLCYVGAATTSLADTMIQYIDEYYPNVSQEELAVLYNTSRVYVCPSLSERQSLGVLEAASCGLPIVDSIYNRGNGLLPSSEVVDPRDIDALCEAIKKQWDAPRNADKIPSWHDVARKLKVIYEHI